jgi:nucleotide-binding universal stress UspA family protein
VTPVQQDVVLGEPGPTITERAHANQADLIVMASHGRTDFQRTLLGSVADEVIRESHVPVLIIRDDLPSLPRLPERVLVPLDGSELSEAVLPYIMPLAQQLGWSLVLLWQVDYPPQSIPVQGAVIPLDFVAERGDAEMVAYLNRVANDLQAKGISAEPRVWFGAKAQSIVEFASQEQMDLIAMSTHGRRGIGRWLRGSTTDYILAHATIPVLTLRPPTR